MSYNDLQVSLVGANGIVVSLSVSNPQPHSETARVRLTVQLLNGTSQTLTSPNFTVAAGATINTQMLALGPIASVTDGPTPIDPL